MDWINIYYSLILRLAFSGIGCKILETQSGKRENHEQDRGTLPGHKRYHL